MTPFVFNINRILIRIFDVLFSFVGILITLPFWFLFGIIIKLDSKGPIIYKQIRVGKAGQDFYVFKFRTMRSGSDKNRLITVGSNDPRVTKIGAFLRRLKLDELPQLVNVIRGDMSIVGPRPEVRRYTDLYSPNEKKIIFSVRPGITDYASIAYSNENILLSKVADPEQYYVNELLPAKIRLNLLFIENQTFGNYLRIIFLTLFKIITP